MITPSRYSLWEKKKIYSNPYKLFLPSHFLIPYLHPHGYYTYNWRGLLGNRPLFPLSLHLTSTLNTFF